MGGLRDLDTGIGSVSSPCDVKGRTLSEREWKWIALHQPHLITYVADREDPNDVRMWVELFDDILENGVTGAKVSDEEREAIKNQRVDLIDDVYSWD